ncbi:sulfurtransferase [Rhodococcus sp. NPDC057135]|uniref:sulfurtransferase n=1 Tax=Rhodococcus sp. NPDC057135 TaxID=3346028 RepID=UPI00362B78B5
MTLPVLIDVEELSALIEAGASPRLLDVRWALGDSNGEQYFREGHIPGAVFVNLDEELASPPSPEKGRHPLPSLEDLQEAARRWGIDDGDSVVLYDATGNTAAARGWWLLRWAGLSDVRLLDGGLQTWESAGLPLAAGIGESVTEGNVTVTGGNMPTVDIDGVGSWTGAGGVLLDARAGERYRGEVEPMDPVAGHIPGAVNAPTAQNITSDGRFLDADGLRERFAGLGVGDKVAVYCGSGVTAAHEIAALAIAGYEATLFPGSWSQWSNDSTRAVETEA